MATFDSRGTKKIKQIGRWGWWRLAVTLVATGQRSDWWACVNPTPLQENAGLGEGKMKGSPLIGARCKSRCHSSSSSLIGRSQLKHGDGRLVTAVEIKAAIPGKRSCRNNWRSTLRQPALPSSVLINTFTFNLQYKQAGRAIGTSPSTTFYVRERGDVRRRVTAH